jgi:O-antigen/teichoic acid export membrane protein
VTGAPEAGGPGDPALGGGSGAASGRDADGRSSVGRLTAVRFVSLLAGFAGSALGARLVGPDGMGAVGAATTFANVASLIGSAGLNIAAIYTLNRSVGSERATVARLMALGSLAAPIAAVLVVASVTLANDLVPGVGSVVGVTALLAGSFLAFELAGALLLGLRNERTYVVIQVVEALATFAATAVLLFLVTRSATGVLLAAAFGYLAGTAVALVVVRRTVGSIRPAWNREFARWNLAFGLRGQVGNVLQFLNLRLDLLLVPTLLGLAAGGVYLIAVRLSEVALIVASSAGTLLFPRVAADGAAASTEMTEGLVRLTLLAIAGAAIGLIVLAEPVLGFVFGEAFAGGATAVRITAIAMLPLALTRVLGGDLKGRGRPGLVSIAALASVVVTIVADLALIPPFGLAGAAVASLLAYSTGAAVVLAAYRRTTGAVLGRLLPGPADVRIALTELRRMAGRRRAPA